MIILLLVLLLPTIFCYESPCNGSTIPFPSILKDEYYCLPFNATYNRALQYLQNNLPSFDIINKGTYGFENDIEGIANVGTNYSLLTRSKYKWAADIPRDLFHEYVLPFSNINEPRTNWRPMFTDAVDSILKSTGDNLDNYTITDVVMAINNGLWNGAVAGQTIVFKSDQTPLIYDPMSTLAYGFASCTGVSVFFVNALRAAGVAARLAGTPAWNGDPNNGNHNWVEVWLPTTDQNAKQEQGSWHFIEAAPAGAGESLSNPCDKWFCNPSNFADGTEVFAARYDQSSSTRYPMAWDLSNTAIPGEDMTSYYQEVCNAC